MRTLFAAVAALFMLSMTTDAGKTDTAAAPAQSGDRSPAGTWSADVVVDGTQFPTATMMFTPAGKLSIRTPVSTATGVWRRTGPTTFDWEGTEVYVPGDGLPGYVQINSHLNLDGETFTSSGESRVYSPEGTFWKTVHTVVTATLSNSAHD